MLSIGEPLAAQAGVVRSCCGWSAYEPRCPRTGGVRAARYQRLDTSLATRRHPRCRVADQRAIACQTETQTTALVFAVDFRMRGCHDLAANEQRAERRQRQARR